MMDLNKWLCSVAGGIMGLVSSFIILNVFGAYGWDVLFVVIVLCCLFVEIKG